jgi:membrane protein YdbS with pleckstrin-like domain
MDQDKGRIIQPPIEQVTSGRVFQPTNAFIGKKMLKAFVIITLIWCLLYVLFLGLTDEFWSEILVAMWQPLEILNIFGWELCNQVYIITALIIFVIGSIYATIYVKRIEYSVLGWEREAMPEIYTKRGIITITKKHVPFRTITHVQTRRGIVDRIFGIGTVQIETAGGTIGAQPTGLIGLLIMKSGATNKSEERVEGIRFHEELRDYILLEMRRIGSASSSHEGEEHLRRKKRIFTRKTLEAFKEVRDALRTSQNTEGGD